MGTLFYGSQSTPISIADRTLSHLKPVIIAKLRRRESFSLSLQHEQVGGRTTLWLDSAIPLRFEFEEPERPQLNREWLEKIAETANLTGGITLVPEHHED